MLCSADYKKKNVRKMFYYTSCNQSEKEIKTHLKSPEISDFI